jgi:hypothetical protein
VGRDRLGCAVGSRRAEVAKSGVGTGRMAECFKSGGMAVINRISSGNKFRPRVGTSELGFNTRLERRIGPELDVTSTSFAQKVLIAAPLGKLPTFLFVQTSPTNKFLKPLLPQSAPSPVAIFREFFKVARYHLLTRFDICISWEDEISQRW